MRSGLCRILLSVAIAGAWSAASAEPAQLRVLGNFTGNKKQVDGVERPFFNRLAKTAGLKAKVTFSPMDLVNVKAPDALRILRAGTFDVASVQIGMASRDDPFFEGLDLAGVATDMASLRKAVDAYRGEFDKRLQAKFNAKVLTLWPFGPQMLFCKKPVKGLEDFKGLKVRTFTPSMATLMQQLGATPVTLQFSEVYQALHSGVADCGVTGPSAANQGKWPEVVSYLVPLSVNGSVQGHFINLNTWKQFSPQQQQKLSAAFKEMEDRMWRVANEASEDAISCSTGKEPCKEHARFKMTLNAITPDEIARMKQAVSKSVLPEWRKICNAVDASCAATWNATVGKAMGLSM
ncbi:MAG: ABC transporter substrate-binding protein [Betaproteobacteria bacterium]|nr:MAG: ABC transporter substrate-binding protein [Betaproteobacteria bacterium]